MADPAAELLASIQRELAPHDNDNRFVPMVVAGKAPKCALAAAGIEELSIIPGDRRAFAALAARAATTPAVDFYLGLAQGESLALPKLPPYIAACGWDDERIAAYQPKPGAQGYSSYVAWLAVNGDPVEVALAMLSNFGAFGRYCSAIAAALRARYGFDDESCGFFDFFAEPTPDLEALALTAVRDALRDGASLDNALRYAKFLQYFELQFWNTLAAIHC